MRSFGLATCGLTLSILASAGQTYAFSGECFFVQVCADNGDECGGAGFLLSFKAEDAEAAGQFADGMHYLVAQEDGRSLSLFILPDGTGKLTRVEERSDRPDTASIAHGACKLKE